MVTSYVLEGLSGCEGLHSMSCELLLCFVLSMPGGSSLLPGQILNPHSLAKMWVLGVDLGSNKVPESGVQPVGHLWGEPIAKCHWQVLWHKLKELLCLLGLLCHRKPIVVIVWQWGWRFRLLGGQSKL